MNEKLQSITEKIYSEGIEKGKKDAEEIISKALAERERINSEAKKEAAAMIEKAVKDAEMLKNNTESELTLYAKQAVNALKTEITDLISDAVVKEAVSAAFSDKEFIQEIILSIVKEWSFSSQLTIKVKDAAALEKFFLSKAKSLLDKKVTIEQVNGIQTHFEIQPADGSYKIAVGDKEFESYFKAFLRPKLLQLLFNERN